MLPSFIESFPDKFTPNEAQVKILTGIDQAFKDGYKFIVCCAPTGSGKSFISKTLSNESSSVSDEFRELITSYAAYKQTHAGSYAFEEDCNDTKSFGAITLTITKALQDQYKDLFNDINVLKGKSNYQCAVDDRYSVETAPCIHTKTLKDDCWSKQICPYYNARNEALVSKFSTLNYNMFFSLPKHVKRRQYIICDEASELEDQLVKQFSCDVKYEFFRKHNITIPPFDGRNYSTVYRWIGSVAMRVESQIDILKDQIQAEKKKVQKDIKMNELLSIRALHSKLKTMIETWEDCEYVFETSTEGINFTPLRVNNLAKYIFDCGDKIILMSATIIDPKNFCKTLGIDKYKYIEVESTFDPKNAPIFVNTKTKLSFNNLKQNLPKIKKQIQEICEFHKTEKGLIHTHTNTITYFLKSQIHGERFLFREPGINNEKLLDKHYNTDEPTVLISPSMSHGVDLKDDFARFQIIVKAPFLPMKEKRIESIMKLDKHWYINKMLSALIQACGRGVRSPSDHCTTYILDGTIIEKVIENRDKLPKYFLDRFV